MLVAAKLEATILALDHDFGADQKYIPCGIVDDWSLD